MEVEKLLLLVTNAGGSRLPILGQLDPWSDTILSRRELPQLEADIDRLEAAAGDDAQRELVTAMRKLLMNWRAEPDLMLHCYGD